MKFSTWHPIVLLVVGILLLFTPAPGSWLAAGLLATAAFALWNRHQPIIDALRRRLRRPRSILGLRFRWSAVLMAVICLSLFLWITTFELPGVIRGNRPIDYDHTVHYVKAWQLKESFLPGRIRGWSHAWFIGHPVGYLYPFAAEVWVILTHYLTLGFLDLGQSYAIALVAMWVLRGVAMYFLARQLLSRSFSLVLAALFLTDTGAFRFDGWNFAVHWGVWPMALSVPFGVLAASRLPKVMLGTRWHEVALFGLWLGLALLCHPVQAVHAVALVISGVVAFVLVRGFDGIRAAMARLGLGSLLAAGIAAPYYLPYAALKDQARGFGAPWQSAAGMAEQLYDLSLLKGTWPVLIALGLLGMILLAVQRRFFGTFVAFIAVATLLGASTTFVDVLKLGAISKTVQFERVSVFLKPYWFVAAGVTLSTLVRYVRTRGIHHDAPKEAMHWHRLAKVFVFVTLIAPFIKPFAARYAADQLKRQLELHPTRERKDALAQLAAWAATQPPATADNFYRFSYNQSGKTTWLSDLAIHMPAPYYKVGFECCSTFKHRTNTAAPEALEAANVRYMITQNVKLEPPNFRLHKTFGDLRVYEFTRWKPQPFKVVEGDGVVVAKHFADEEIVLQAQDGAHGQLRLNVAHFPRWQATRNGQPVPIRLTSYGLMLVDLQPGEYRFVFQRGWVEPLSGVLFGLSMLAVFGLCLKDRLRASLMKLETSPAPASPDHRAIA